MHQQGKFYTKKNIEPKNQFVSYFKIKVELLDIKKILVFKKAMIRTIE